MAAIKALVELGAELGAQAVEWDDSASAQRRSASGGHQVSRELGRTERTVRMFPSVSMPMPPAVAPAAESAAYTGHVEAEYSAAAVDTPITCSVRG